MLWYIVKRNWEPIVRALRSTFASTIIERYIGLGGETWPLETEQDSEASELHSRMLSSRDYVSLADGSQEAVCVDQNMAREYFRLCAARFDGVVMLEVSPESNGGGNANGLDFGHAAGGYSVIETEILGKGDLKAGRALNSHGLFGDRVALMRFVEALRENDNAEDMDMYEAFFIRLVS